MNRFALGPAPAPSRVKFKLDESPLAELPADLRAAGHEADTVPGEAARPSASCDATS
jgi:hypothetical protein